MYKVSDFKVGQTVYLELIGNASRGITKRENLIRECVVAKVGRRYVTVNGRQFEETDRNYGGLVEHSSYSPDYVLYPTREELELKLEREELQSNFRHWFTMDSKLTKLSIDQLRRIKQIIDEDE